MSSQGGSKSSKGKKKDGAADGAQPMDVDNPAPSTSSKPKLPAHLELQRTRVVLGPEMNKHVSALQVP